MTTALQLAQIERTIGSGVMLTRFTFGALLTTALNYLMPLSIPTTLLFSLAPSFIGLVPAQKQITVVSKLTLSEKCLQYYLFYQLPRLIRNRVYLD